jgi:DNA repair exonuclease SbcCD ATPase subunit
MIVSRFMASGSHRHVVGRLATVLLLGLIAVAAAPILRAAEEQGASDALSPIDEYAKKVEEFTRSAPELGKKIEETTKSIDATTDANKAREQIGELRSVVSDLLGQVSDNGTVAQLGAKALAHARRKLAELERETRFKPEERQFLIDQWRQLLTETEQATDDLEKARTEFADLLRTLQGREDFIDELLQIRRAAEAINVIRQLAGEIRAASDKLRTLIGGIKPPGV